MKDKLSVKEYEAPFREETKNSKSNGYQKRKLKLF